MVKYKTDVSYSPIEPLQIVESKTPFFFVSADVGITIATGVSAWADQSGNGNNFTQGSGAAQPDLVANDTDFGGRNSVYNTSGGSRILINTWIPPLPGTTPIWFFLVFRQVAWTAADFIFSANSTTSQISLVQTGSSPSLVMSNTTSANTNSSATIGSSVRGEVSFTNSTSDYLKLGSNSVTGTNAGNNNATASGLRLFSRNGSTQSSDAKIACIGAWNGEPTANEKSALDMWVKRYYGNSILI